MRQCILKGMITGAVLGSTVVAASHSASAMETEFLSDGGVRYTLNAGDFVYSAYTDEQEFKYVDPKTGVIDRSLAIFDTDPGKGSSSLRRSLEEFEEAARIPQSVDALQMKLCTYAGNLKYWRSHARAHNLASSTEMHLGSDGHVELNVTYRATGWYAICGNENVFANHDIFTIDPRLYGTSSSGRLPEAKNVSFRQPNLNDLQPVSLFHIYPGNFANFYQNLSHTTTSSFDIETDGVNLVLNLGNKLPGIGFQIEKIILTHTPKNN